MPWVNTTLPYEGRCYSFEVYRKDVGSSNNAACIMMMARYALGLYISQEEAEDWLDRAEESRNYRKSVSGDMDQRRRVHDLDAPCERGGVKTISRTALARGVSAGLLYFALSRNFPAREWLWILPGRGTSMIGDQLLSCSATTPALASLYWDDPYHKTCLGETSAGHIVVCLGRVPTRSGKDLLFLDPEYGVVICDYMTCAEWTGYNSTNNSFHLPGDVGYIDEAVLS